MLNKELSIERDSCDDTVWNWKLLLQLTVKIVMISYIIAAAPDLLLDMKD